MQYPWPAGEIRISLSVEEAEAFHEAAAREGQSLEGWVRAQCLRAAVRSSTNMEATTAAGEA